MINRIACPHCGAQQPADARYCDQCSVPLQALPPSATAAPVSVPVSGPAANPAASAPDPGPVTYTAGFPAPAAASAPAPLPRPPRPHAGGPPLLLLGGVGLALVVFLVGMGVVLGGSLAGVAPTALVPTADLPATIALMMQARATQQAADASLSTTPAAPATPPPATLVPPSPAPDRTALPTLVPTEIVAQVATTAPTVGAQAEPTNSPTLVPTQAADGPTATARTSLTIPLAPLNASGEQGTAVLTDEYDLGTRIVIQMTGAPITAQPAHIHLGTCDNIAPKPSFPLKNVVKGRSETLLPISFGELTKGVYLINVHTSETRLEPYVACGELH